MAATGKQVLINAVGRSKQKEIRNVLARSKENNFIIRWII